MAEGGSATSTLINSDLVPNIQILNVVPQKVIQVDKPIGYYGNKEKTKMFIY